MISKYQPEPSLNQHFASGDSSTRYGSTKTWLIHLLEKINIQREKEDLPSISARNYANPGDTVEDDLSDQLTRFFDRFPKKSSPQDQPILDPSETCYVFWLGINDCGRTMEEDLEEITKTLIEDGIEELYTKASARNFLIFDVPPKDRSPGGLEMPDLANQISTWNTHLKDLTTKFVEESTLASLFLFSTNQVVTEILDNPTTYDFQEDDVDQEGGGIWMDELHFTSEVHTIIADKLHQALSKFDSTSNRISDL
ncbi:hypothetical protein C8Q75DRAFT_578347 [Abortiporus biennis]|nr:hypothetical protein C8Q75DRAFT_578347 [Abortiporus biennis]